jgi:hypothetical protein
MRISTLLPADAIRLPGLILIAVLAYANCEDGTCHVTVQGGYCFDNCCYSFVHVDCSDFTCTFHASACNSGAWDAYDNCGEL